GSAPVLSDAAGGVEGPTRALFERRTPHPAPPKLAKWLATAAQPVSRVQGSDRPPDDPSSCRGHDEPLGARNSHKGRGFLQSVVVAGEKGGGEFGRGAVFVAALRAGAAVAAVAITAFAAGAAVAVTAAVAARAAVPVASAAVAAGAAIAAVTARAAILAGRA